MNGEVLNEGMNAEIPKGKICLQAEGTEIHFRNIRLIPLKKTRAPRKPKAVEEPRAG